MSKLITMGNISPKKLPVLTTQFDKKLKCKLKDCLNDRSILDGAGKGYCLAHRDKHRQHNGSGRPEHPITFYKKNECEVCGFDPYLKESGVCDPGGALHVHHIVPKAPPANGDESKGNALTCCHPCHNNVHHYIRVLQEKAVLQKKDYHKAVKLAKQKSAEAEILRGVLDQK